ncbi:MAG TPA: hypothetical protein PKX60_06150, partial [Prolixibacteraceae bacterium]|nr:hypothetical protein [Prolixibacteraceae bacterium]
MKNIFIFLAFTLILLVQPYSQKQAVAVMAYPYHIAYKQPDGTTVRIKLKGDERVRWAETADGYSLLRNKNGGWEYGTLDKNGDLVCSGVLAKDISKRTIIDNSILEKTQKKLTFSKTQVGILKQIAHAQRAPLKSGFPVNGSVNMLVIL